MSTAERHGRARRLVTVALAVWVALCIVGLATDRLGLSVTALLGALFGELVLMLLDAKRP